MEVNNIGNLQRQMLQNLSRTPTATQRQLVKNTFIAQQAESALLDGQDVAMQDTLEDLSLALGSRLKNIKGDAAKSEEEIRNNLLQEIAEQSDIEVPGLETGDTDTLMAMLNNGDLPTENAILILSAWRGTGKLKGKHEDIDNLLQRLCESDPDWALKLFASMELGEVPASTLSTLQKVMERFQRPDEDGAEKLWYWFEQVKEWPDRAKRLRVLLRTCALDLNCCLDESRKLQLSQVLFELKKLLLFLGIEDHAQRLANCSLVPQEQVLKMLITTIEQTWVAPEWVMQQLVSFDIPQSSQILYAGGLRDTMKLLPALCFLDEEQREQIIEAIAVCYDRLSDEEG